SGRNSSKKNKISIEKNEKIATSKSIEFIKFLAENIIFFVKGTAFYNEIMNYKPDYIYTIGGNIFSLKLAYKISKKLKIPLVIHFMDNWKDVVYQDSPI